MDLGKKAAPLIKRQLRWHDENFNEVVWADLKVRLPQGVMVKRRVDPSRGRVVFSKKDFVPGVWFVLPCGIFVKRKSWCRNLEFEDPKDPHKRMRAAVTNPQTVDTFFGRRSNIEYEIIRHHATEKSNVAFQVFDIAHTAFSWATTPQTNTPPQETLPTDIFGPK